MEFRPCLHASSTNCAFMSHFEDRLASYFAFRRPDALLKSNRLIMCKKHDYNFMMTVPRM